MKSYVKWLLVSLGVVIGVGANIYVDYLQAQPIAGPQPEINLKVTQDELNLISEGLQTQPFGKVVPLINKLREQIAAQQPKPVPTPLEKPVDVPKE